MGPSSGGCNGVLLVMVVNSMYVHFLLCAEHGSQTFHEFKHHERVGTTLPCSCLAPPASRVTLNTEQ
jgi:hypothetical protein